MLREERCMDGAENSLQRARDPRPPHRSCGGEPRLRPQHSLYEEERKAATIHMHVLRSKRIKRL